MKSLTWLLDCMLKEASIRCDTDTHRDIVTVSRRTKHEGISFVTITLPRFGQEFEFALESGEVVPTLFQGFRKKGALPAFLQGLLGQVFDPSDGKLLPQPNVEAILSVRQICLAHKKVYLPCSERRTRKAYARYLEVEKELTGLLERIPPELLKEFEEISGILWSGLLGDLAFKLWNHELVPKHGPGATAEGISGNQKFHIKQWHTRLQEHFPFDMYGVPSPCLLDWKAVWSNVEFVEPGAEIPVRVITVPKTLKTPRIIAIEPVCNQYIQQALLESIVPYIETRGYSAGHVNFHDQSVNRELALENSRTGRLATMDLSEASDRVHKDLVALMLSSAPVVRDAIFACRSTKAELPDGVIVFLEKFASMGSGLCFPIEAMVFFTLCIQARLKALNLRPTSANIKRVLADVYVYGDDLIIPADEVSAIAVHLELFGLKVNNTKTFGKGLFRESCGMDAYAGEPVTPVYIRYMPPSNRQNVSELVSYVSLANQLYRTGWWETAKRVQQLVESILGSLPVVQDTSPCLGWVSVSNAYSVQRWNDTLHRFEVRGYTVKSQEQADPLSGSGALMKYHLKRGEPPIFGRHLERTVRPGSVSIKYRWVLPH